MIVQCVSCSFEYPAVGVSSECSVCGTRNAHGETDHGNDSDSHSLGSRDSIRGGTAATGEDRYVDRRPSSARLVVVRRQSARSGSVR